MTVEILGKQNHIQHGVWIRARLTTCSGPNLSHLIYWVPRSPVLTMYVSFDLLTLTVSLKISNSISSAILKPLKLPERRTREGAHSQRDVYLAFSTGLWLSELWLLAEHIRLAGAPLSAGYRAPLTGSCIPASMVHTRASNDKIVHQD